MKNNDFRPSSSPLPTPLVLLPLPSRPLHAVDVVDDIVVVCLPPGRDLFLDGIMVASILTVRFSSVDLRDD